SNTGGKNILTGDVTLAGNATVSVGTGEIKLSGEVKGPGGLTKVGGFSLVLTHANSYTGQTTVSDGLLNIQNSLALGTGDGTPASGTTVQNGGVLQFQGGVDVANEYLTLNPTVPGAPAALANFSGNNVWEGPVNLMTTTRVTAEGQLTLKGVISGPGGLTKESGGGTLELAG